METDRLPSLIPIDVKDFINIAEIWPNLSGVQSHNALGARERYPSHFRDIHLLVRQEHPKIRKAFRLSFFVKPMNERS